MIHAFNNMPFLKYEKKLIELTDTQIKYITYKIDKQQIIPLGIERLNPKKCEIYKQLPYDYQDYEIIKIEKKVLSNKNDGQKWIEERNKLLELSAKGKTEEDYSRFKLMYNIIYGKDVNIKVKKEYEKITEKWFEKNPERTMVDSRTIWFSKVWGKINRTITIFSERALIAVIITENRDKLKYN